jgi:hypothetical protein
MPRKGDVHVVPGDHGWRVEVEGASGARATHGTQGEAARTGRRIAQRNRSELVVHGRDGSIRERNSYGRDPHPPKG